MAITIPYLNPVRFRPYANQVGGLINNDMPRIDEMANQTQYYKGVYPLENYKADWKLNEKIVIQLRNSDPGFVPKHINLTTPSGIISIDGILRSSASWLGDPVYNYEYTPTEIGDYYFTTNYSDSVSWISDIFHVHSNEMNLVEFQYYDSENRYGGLFWNQAITGGWVWQPKAYFTGIQDVGEPKNEYSIYTDESGEPRKIQSEPQDTIQIDFTDITKRHIKQLNRIFSCDNILVNNQPVENTENIKIDPILKSDAMNASINLVQTNNNDFVKNY